MTGEYKLLSHTKTIKIADATPITGQELDKHGIVLVGHRMGVVMDKLMKQRLLFVLTRSGILPQRVLTNPICRKLARGYTSSHRTESSPKRKRAMGLSAITGGKSAALLFSRSMRKLLGGYKDT